MGQGPLGRKPKKAKKTKEAPCQRCHGQRAGEPPPTSRGVQCVPATSRGCSAIQQPCQEPPPTSRGVQLAPPTSRGCSAFQQPCQRASTDVQGGAAGSADVQGDGCRLQRSSSSPSHPAGSRASEPPPTSRGVAGRGSKPPPTSRGVQCVPASQQRASDTSRVGPFGRRPKSAKPWGQSPEPAATRVVQAVLRRAYCPQARQAGEGGGMLTCCAGGPAHRAVLLFLSPGGPIAPGPGTRLNQNAQGSSLYRAAAGQIGQKGARSSAPTHTPVSLPPPIYTALS